MLPNLANIEKGISEEDYDYDLADSLVLIFLNIWIFSSKFEREVESYYLENFE